MYHIKTLYWNKIKIKRTSDIVRIVKNKNKNYKVTLNLTNKVKG